MTRRLGLPLFDADNHLYETKDAFTRHLPDRYKGAIDYVDVRGRTKVVVRGTISEYIPNPTFEVVARPGAQEEYFRIGNPDGKSYREIIGEPMRSIPAFREPGPRLELMDELGVDRALMFPTLASLLEERMRDDLLIRPAPVPAYGGSRSFGFEEFDPFWQAVVDNDVLVSMHAPDSGYSRYQGSDYPHPRGPRRAVQLHRPPAGRPLRGRGRRRHGWQPGSTHARRGGRRRLTPCEHRSHC
jgi:hypothetical protein